MDRTFQFSRTFRRVGLGLLIAIGVMYGVVSALGALEGDFGLTLGLGAVALPLGALGLYWFVRHSGTVRLTEDAVILERFGQQRRLAYEDVVDVWERDAHIPSNYVLEGRNRTLRFSREIEGFSDLYATLLQRVPPLRNLADVDFPLVLKLSWDYFLDLALGLLVVVALFGGLIYLIARNTGLSSADLFFMSLAFLLVLGLFAGALVPEVRKKPLMMAFERERIQVHPLLGETQAYDARRIRAIRIEEKVEETQFVSRWAWQTLKSVVHPLVIDFADGERLTIREKQAWQFGYAPERLHAILRHLYTSSTQGVGARLLARGSGRNKG
jgi:hypothetical protein